MKFKQMSEEIHTNIGGVDNITHVEHCATRLRIHFKNKQLINEEAIKNIEHVVGIVSKTGQLQIIIGPSVHEAYQDFMDVSQFEEKDNNTSLESIEIEESDEKKDFLYYVNKFGNFSAAIFMPVVPALIVGGLILAIKNLLVNYFNVPMESGTALLMTAIFSAGFSFLPVYLGYTTAKRLKIEPIMGAFLGCLLVSQNISGVTDLDFLGISIPNVDYSGSILPVILGVFVMSYVDKLFEKIIPETIKYFLKPLLTMIIVVPIVLIILGPLGTKLSEYAGNGVMFLMDYIGGIALPFLSMLYPYMVMLGFDKALSPVGFAAIESLGYDPVYVVMGFISNLCIGGTALAVASSLKDKGKKGMTYSFAITALCGVTEPAFYGALITRPKVLIGTAAGALSAGLVAGIFGLKSYVMGFCPGLLTALFFVAPDGSAANMILAAIVVVVAVVVSFVVTKIVLIRTGEATDAEKAKKLSVNTPVQ
ncbi:PTS transporter subunit EIIC [Enterococcus casseliflavus]|uniref:PTS transporter subunit EIIC n=1 Tax=Enterococcus casseliflavus TaxID=37734 RepID=UPI001E5B5CC6|nr:PTS transporter subunit EIIC [Enterococcus casseliflavus]MCD4962550.1 PTS transporter subunit EIIC [Enterococcus casseliflavus]